MLPIFITSLAKPKGISPKAILLILSSSIPSTMLFTPVSMTPPRGPNTNPRSPLKIPESTIVPTPILVLASTPRNSNMPPLTMTLVAVLPTKGKRTSRMSLSMSVSLITLMSLRKFSMKGMPRTPAIPTIATSISDSILVPMARSPGVAIRLMFLTIVSKYWKGNDINWVTIDIPGIE